VRLRPDSLLRDLVNVSFHLSSPRHRDPSAFSRRTLL